MTQCNVEGCAQEAEVTLTYSDDTDDKQYCMRAGLYHFKSDDNAEKLTKGV